jgi:hypothetical protein
LAPDQVNFPVALVIEYTRQGRWGGRLTNRPLPRKDVEIDRLSDQQRDELALIWLGRAASERRVADAFKVIHNALDDLGSSGELIALATRAVDDEYRHAELSRLVASRYAGQQLEPPARLELVVPEHPDAPARLRHTLHILGHCAMNETFASAFLDVSLNYARGSLASAALRALFSDEIDHARLGWAHLAELRESDRSEIIPWLPALVHANLKMWRDTTRPYPTDSLLHRHGAPPAEAVEQALLNAIRQLIIPGLEHFGLPTDVLRRWLAAGAPTETPASNTLSVDPT